MAFTSLSFRASACSMASAGVSPATNRLAMGGIIHESGCRRPLSTPLPGTRGFLSGARPPTRMDLVGTVAVAVWAMLPAYVPNNAAVLAGGGRPIDGGRTWGGRRVLGDGKTWRGTAVGTLVGVALAAALNALRPAATDALGVTLPEFPVVAMFTLAFGAMLGD